MRDTLIIAHSQEYPLAENEEDPPSKVVVEFFEKYAAKGNPRNAAPLYKGSDSDISLACASGVSTGLPAELKEKVAALKLADEFS